MVIKTYSPNLMVHPYMRQSKNLVAGESEESVISEVIGMLNRIHVLVIGPGLGRDDLMLKTSAEVIREARKRRLPFILDADGLNLAQTQPELVHGYSECILTPNVVEFARLAKSMDLDISSTEPDQACAMLAKKFGGITIIQKGTCDYISNGEQTLISDGQGGLKRSGGQGDTLTGCLATMLAWRKAYLENLWQHDGNLNSQELLALSAYGGSAITRECSRRAFLERGRSLQAGDLTEYVHTAFEHIVGEPGTDKKSLD